MGKTTTSTTTTTSERKVVGSNPAAGTLGDSQTNHAFFPSNHTPSKIGKLVAIFFPQFRPRKYRNSFPQMALGQKFLERPTEYVYVYAL